LSFFSISSCHLGKPLRFYSKSFSFIILDFHEHKIHKHTHTCIELRPYFYVFVFRISRKILPTLSTLKNTLISMLNVSLDCLCFLVNTQNARTYTLTQSTHAKKVVEFLYFPFLKKVKLKELQLNVLVLVNKIHSSITSDQHIHLALSFSTFLCSSYSSYITTRLREINKECSSTTWCISRNEFWQRSTISQWIKYILSSLIFFLLLSLILCHSNKWWTKKKKFNLKKEVNNWK
jgi:hypothetical protein